MGDGVNGAFLGGVGLGLFGGSEESNRGSRFDLGRFWHF